MRVKIGEGTGRQKGAWEEEEEEDEDDKEEKEEEKNEKLLHRGKPWGVACVGDSAGTQEGICGSLVCFLEIIEGDVCVRVGSVDAIWLKIRGSLICFFGAGIFLPLRVNIGDGGLALGEKNSGVVVRFFGVSVVGGDAQALSFDFFGLALAVLLGFAALLFLGLSHSSSSEHFCVCLLTHGSGFCSGR